MIDVDVARWRPVLSVCIPAYNRPQLVRIALRSVLDSEAAVTSKIEVVVSDDSTDHRVGEVCLEELNHWGGSSSYRHNAPPLGMAGNWNRCVGLSRGRYVLILHDDDFLLPGGVDVIVRTLESFDRPPAAVLFGVRVVDAEGRPRRRQATVRRRYLPPAMALSSLLGNSSFVRFPGMVVARSAYQAARPFDESLGEVADVLMWVRLAGSHGLWLEPVATAAYRVHGGALTTRMWRSETLEALNLVFEDEVVRLALRPDERHRHRARFLSQFLVAGAWRRLRAGDLRGASEVLDLFDAPAMAGTQIPLSRRAGRGVLSVVATARCSHPERPPAEMASPSEHIDA